MNLATINSILQSGISSIEEAEKVVQSTELVVKNFLPALAWTRAKPAVDSTLSEMFR